MKTLRPADFLFALLMLAASLLSGHAAFEPRALPQLPTEEEKEHWRRHGRTLPGPELLQPTLDAALPEYKVRSAAGLKVRLRGTTSDVLVDLTQRWIAAFQRRHPEVVIELVPPYAGSLGARELIKGDLDFVIVSRELKPDDLTDFQARFGYDPFSVPIAGGTWRHFGFLDAVAVCVHKDNPLERLTFAQLDALLSSTRHRGGAPVRTWGQLGLTGEWTDRPVNVWAIAPWNGFEEFVRQRMLSVGKRRGEWRTDLNFVKTVFPVSAEVAADRYAIGYAGLAYLGPGVKLLALDEGETGAAVAPGYEEVATARYPLSRLCYMNLNRQPGRPPPPAVAEFMRFILSREGQQVILEQGVFLPLRANQAADSLALLEQ